MSENTEAKLLDNLDVLIGAITPLGAAYTPPLADASLANLQAKHAAAQAAVDALDQAQTAEDSERNVRQTRYEDLNSHGASLVKYAQASGFEPNVVSDVREKVRELRGDRASPKRIDNPLTLDVDESQNTISASQASFASREATYSEMIIFLDAQGYAATENGFKPADLLQRRNNMRLSNAAVARTAGAKADARQQLDQICYTGAANLVKSANAAKNYLKAVFAGSQAYQTVRHLEFRVPKRLR